MSDILFPASSLLPLAERGDGAYTPEIHVPGPLRPLSASLGVVVPIEAGKHATKRSRVTKAVPTEVSDDGNVVPDTRHEVYTDD
ncbi:MAG TPA: hypothetical protein VLJ59_16470 [Mycobacteriales bacterium]|nr:hypothetical protein [Mycobacteriales bacterium]